MVMGIEEERSVEKAYLGEHERIYNESTKNTQYQAGSFLLLCGSVECEILNSAYYNQRKEPNFDLFEALLRDVSLAISKLLPQIEVGVNEHGGLLCYCTAKILKILEQAFDHLGAAAIGFDLGEGIHKCHVDKMGSFVWYIARTLGQSQKAKKSDLIELYMRLNRLQYLIDRLSNDNPDRVVVDIVAIRKMVERKKGYLTVGGVEWVCDNCLAVNTKAFLYCQACNSEDVGKLQVKKVDNISMPKTAMRMSLDLNHIGTHCSERL